MHSLSGCVQILCFTISLSSLLFFFFSPSVLSSAEQTTHHLLSLSFTFSHYPLFLLNFLNFKLPFSVFALYCLFFRVFKNLFQLQLYQCYVLGFPMFLCPEFSLCFFKRVDITFFTNFGSSQIIQLCIWGSSLFCFLLKNL